MIDDFHDMRISGIANRIITGIIPDSLDAPSLKLKPMWLFRPASIVQAKNLAAATITIVTL